MTGRFTTRTRRARNAIAAERERTVAERTAFETFERRVTTLPTGRPDLDRASSPTRLPGSFSKPSPSALAGVRAAYRETVVSLSHYDEEYGEPVLENVAAEFGEGIGAAVAGSDVFTAELKRALRSAARDAASRRATFVSVLDDERAALDDAIRELRAIADGSTDLDLDSVSFATLQETHDRLRSLTERCETLAAERQNDLRKPRAGGRWHRDDRSLNAYLYNALDVTYPVLADASAAAATLRRERRRVERALVRAV